MLCEEGDHLTADLQIGDVSIEQQPVDTVDLQADVTACESRLSGRQSRPSCAIASRMTSVVNINDVLDGHVSLEIDCVDRLLLNAYVPNLQVSGQVVTFLTEHLGFPIPSPALLEKIGNRFRREVKAFAAEHEIPVLAPIPFT